MIFTNFFRDIARAILLLVAGILTYGAIAGSFFAADPTEPEPAHPALAGILAIVAITVFLVGLIQFYRGKKYWWLAMLITMIVSIVAITCLLPEVGA